MTILHLINYAVGNSMMHIDYNSLQSVRGRDKEMKSGKFTGASPALNRFPVKSELNARSVRQPVDIFSSFWFSARLFF